MTNLTPHPLPVRRGEPSYTRLICGLIRLSVVIISVAVPLLGVSAGIAKPAATDAPYRVVETHGIWWLETPDGNPFFSLGVCCVLRGDTPKSFNPKNPGYAAYQEYSSPKAWANATLARLKSWNYTTIGGWSDLDILRKSKQFDMPFEVMIPIGMGAGAPWLDMWDPKVIANMDKIARDAILPVRSDPHLVGYFTDNELGWWNGALFEYTLAKHKPTSIQRQKLIALLRSTYRDRWDLLTEDFEPSGADSFAKLERGGTLYLRPGGNGIRVVHEFAGMMAHRYYQLVHDIVRKYDKRGLILGDRYQSFYYPEVAAAAAPYIDILSSNLNANWRDGGVARYYFDTLHALTGKPIIASEFYVASAENRSGNQNNSSGFLVVPTQAQRAVVFRNELTHFLSRPYIVGADWFQYFDEPANGRGDGENYDMGLVDIHDRPYRDITAASGAMDLDALKERSTDPPPDIILQGIPRAPVDPMAGDTDRTLMLEWDRRRGFVPASSRYPVADLYTCWDSQAVYLGISAMDPVETTYYKDGVSPAQDCEQVLISGPRLPHPLDLSLRDTEGKQAEQWSDSGVTIRRYGPVGNVRNAAMLDLPASLLSKAGFLPGDLLRLHVTLFTHARGYRMDWSIRSRLAP